MACGFKFRTAHQHRAVRVVEIADDRPDEQAAERGSQGRCRALSDQIAVLSDGTVVPCCLDNEGALALGNLFRQALSDILASLPACAIREGFARGERAAPLCRRCGYAERFGAR